MDLEEVSTGVTILEFVRIEPANCVQRLVDIADVMDKESQVETLSQIVVDRWLMLLLSRLRLLERVDHLVDSPCHVERVDAFSDRL